jgi:hypothetical protein
MNDQELRSLVRDAIARHLAGARPEQPGAAPATFLRGHASHGTFVLPSGADLDGPCLIEPTVMCNHCGYCQSFGH